MYLKHFAQQGESFKEEPVLRPERYINQALGEGSIKASVTNFNRVYRAHRQAPASVTPSPTSTMIEVCIPALERKADESGKLQKFFRVEILFNGRKHFVFKRHREFLSLHKKLKKILQTPEFPNKRSPHFRQKPLNQRRQELEDYVKMVLSENEEVPQEMLDFLQLKHFHSVTKMSSPQCLDASHPEVHNCQLLHQRVVGFLKDPYLLDSTSDLPDVIVDGVLLGLYPRDIRVSFKTSTEPCGTKPWPPSQKPTGLEVGHGSNLDTTRDPAELFTTLEVH